MSGCVSVSCDVISLLITFAQLGQFLPQHWEMMAEKSAVGVSPYLLFFNTLYTYLAAVDNILLDTPARLRCTGSWFRCFMDAQPMIQMIGSAILCATMWYWFLKYHHSEEEADSEEQKLFDNIFYSPSTGVFLRAMVISMAGFTVIAVVLVLFGGWENMLVIRYAHLCGVLSAILNGIMWIPQIVVTGAYGHKGALSIDWVFLSLFMDIAYSIYLAVMGQHWSVWANNVPDGIQTAILLVMLFRIEYLERRRRRGDYHQFDPLSAEERQQSW